MVDASRIEGRAAFDNWVISNLNSLCYKMSEPIILKLMRAKHAHLYKNPDEEPLITVLIPTYNRAKLLMERAVPSVLSQTYKNFELLIIGDCCTDDTEKKLSTINDPRIVFHNLQRRWKRYPDVVENHWFAGSVVPTNKGLELAKGKWIARLDDDDLWTPNHLEALLRFAQRGNYEFVSGQYIEERHGKKRLDNGVGARDPYYTRCEMSKIEGCNPKIGGSLTWFYRSYLRFMRYNINCWRKKWNRVCDIDLSLRIFQSGVKMGFLEEIVAFMIPRPGETAVGLEAYKLSETSKLSHFSFDR